MTGAPRSAYLVPGTAVLANKLDLRDAAQLQAFEREVTALRLAQLRQHPIAPTFDLAHLQAIHHHLFQDVYPFAGVLREVDIAKGHGATQTRFARTTELQAGGAALAAAIHQGPLLNDPTPATFAREMGRIYAACNLLHPFREGNGRTTREFMTQLGEAAGYALDYALVDGKTWNDAAALSAHGQLDPMTKVFQTIATPLRAGPQQEAVQSERALRASLREQGYTVVDREPGHNGEYIGPVVATSAQHVAQDIGRRRVVIHSARALEQAPRIGDRLTVHVRGGLARVQPAALNTPGRAR